PSRRAAHAALFYEGNDLELPHPARLVSNGLADLHTGSKNRGVIRVDVLDVQVRVVRMIADLGGRNTFRASPRHDGAIPRRIKKPAGIWVGVNGESEHVLVESR